MRNRLKQGRKRRDRGLTLLELVIAVAVLAIGTLAALRATDQSRRALAGAPVRMLAQLAAENRAEELRLYGSAAGLPGTVELGGRIFALSVETERTAAGLATARITARAETGEGAQLLAVLPGGLPGAGQ